MSFFPSHVNSLRTDLNDFPRPSNLAVLLLSRNTLPICLLVLVPSLQCSQARCLCHFAFYLHNTSYWLKCCTLSFKPGIFQNLIFFSSILWPECNPHYAWCTPATICFTLTQSQQSSLEHASILGQVVCATVMTLVHILSIRPLFLLIDEWWAGSQLSTHQSFARHLPNHLQWIKFFKIA